MRKGTPEQVALKREEIVDACEQLYQTMSFREITLKEISKITSFSRPTISPPFHAPRSITTFRQKKRSSWHFSSGSMTAGTKP